MKKWLFLFALWCALPILANAQSGVRYGEAAPIISGQTPGGPLSSVPNASISWCNSPANAVPCTNKATTYTDITLTTSCPTSTQVVLIGSTSCVAKTDSYGNWGVWVAAGTYTYTVTLSSGATEGPYTVTLASGGGGGAGNPAGNPCQPQYNNNGAFAGIADWCFDGSHTLTIGPSGIITLQAGVALNGITNEMLPLTLTSSTTGSAAKWTLPRLLAGNSVDGSANVPFPNAFIVGGLSDAGLTGAQFLGNLATCVLKNTTGTAPNLSCAASADLPFPTGLTGQALTANNGSPPAFASPGVGGRKVLTSTGDIILGDSLTSTRDRGTTIRYTSASPETVTLPQAGSGCPSNCFSSNFVFSLFQTGAGQQTITPTTSTINDQSTLAMIQNSWCSVSSPDNSNYLARCATYAKTGTGLNSTFNADGSTTFALNTALPNGETATTQAGGSNDTKVATDAYVDAAKSALNLTTVKYDFDFCGGISAEGLVGSKWYADTAGNTGSISRSTAAVPDANHQCNLALVSGTSATQETGIILGYCNDNNTTIPCSGVQAADDIANPSTILFDSYFIFKNPSTFTTVRLSGCYTDLAASSGCDQSANPKQVVGVMFDSSAGDTHWMAVTGDATGGGGAHNTRTSTGVTPVVNDWTCVHIYSTVIGTIQFQVGDSATSACSSLSSPISIATTLPTVALSPAFSITPLASSATRTMIVNRYLFATTVAP